MYQIPKRNPKDIDRLIEQAQDQTNKAYYQLHDKLIVVGTIILSIFPTILLSDTTYQKTREKPELFIWVITTVILSILFGIFQLLWDWKVLSGLTTALGHIKSYLTGRPLKKRQEAHIDKYIDQNGTGTDHTGNFFLLLQSLSLIASLILIFFVVRYLIS
ncbi:MAG TPA: hypothetical protein VMQ44_02375 [Candidatus Saccharimonadales bacterium]|nr:hypothetical protein [Candidatus Saccharimonadales bacterium]